MLNKKVVNDQPGALKTTLYGSDNETPAYIFPDGALSVSGSLAFPENTTVSITGTSSVSVVGTLPITGAVTLDGSPTVTLGARTFTSILVTVFQAGGLIALGGIDTEGIDVSQYADYTYALHAQNTGVLSTYTVQPQIAPIDVSSYYTDNGTAGNINIAVLGGTSNLVLKNDDLLQYSRLEISGGIVGAILAVTLYLQGQY